MIYPPAQNSIADSQFHKLCLPLCQSRCSPPLPASIPANVNTNHLLPSTDLPALTDEHAPINDTSPNGVLCDRWPDLTKVTSSGSGIWLISDGDYALANYRPPRN
jgi:hypothetical protein